MFDTPSIGTCTKHGIAPVRGSRTGQAKINQDRGVVCWPYNGSTGQALFAIFDGHGKQGEKVSEFCMTTIPKLLESQPSLASADAVPAALHTTIVECDRQLMEGDLQGVARTAGTTSTVCYLRGNEIWVACSGDSRAVLCSLPGDHIAATDMSKDFKPELPEERARIEALGGEVTVSGPRGLPPSRVWGPNGTAGLAMSRSVGDHNLRQYGVICDPEIKKFDLKPATGKEDGDLFLIVASDGVWEFIDSTEACEVIATETDATKACQKLVNLAQTRWFEEEGSYRDDITCIVAMLPFLEEDGGDAAGDNAAEADAMRALNMGKAGTCSLAAGKDKADPRAASSPAVSAGVKPVVLANSEEKGTHEDFVKRRLSMTSLDIDPENDEEEEEEEDA